MELQQKAQKEVSELKSKLEEDILVKVRGIAEDIAKAKSYTGIFDCSALIYKQQDMDITSDVISSLDKSK